MRTTLRAFALVFALAMVFPAGSRTARTVAGEPMGGPAPAATQAEGAKAPVPTAAAIEPEALARILRAHAGEKPLIFQVGVRFLYKEAHIAGAEYIGPALKDEGLAQLRQRVRSLAHNKAIVLYCGCCPWDRCPNVQPAYEALQALGFTQVKVLHIEHNFGTDWVNKGYPTAKGE